MTEVTITVADKVVLQSPYHPALPARAKAIGGRFDGSARTWSFDPRDEDRVRSLAREIYGTDGSAPAETVTVRLQVNSRDQSVWCCGREVATRRYRDSEVILGEGVVIVDGGFARRGGSRNYPAVGGPAVVEIRDLPAEIARREAETNPDCTIVEESAAPEAVTVVLAGDALAALQALRDGSTSDEDIVAAALAAYASSREAA